MKLSKLCIVGIVAAFVWPLEAGAEPPAITPPAGFEGMPLAAVALTSILVLSLLRRRRP
jgi:hypothetical protein